MLEENSVGEVQDILVDRTLLPSTKTFGGFESPREQSRRRAQLCVDLGVRCLVYHKHKIPNITEIGIETYSVQNSVIREH